MRKVFLLLAASMFLGGCVNRRAYEAKVGELKAARKEIGNWEKLYAELAERHQKQAKLFKSWSKGIEEAERNAEGK